MSEQQAEERGMEWRRFQGACGSVYVLILGTNSRELVCFWRGFRPQMLQLWTNSTRQWCNIRSTTMCLLNVLL